MEDMARYSDELIVLKDAALLTHGNVEEVFRQAEIIASAGLRLPQVTRVMLSLMQNGVAVDTARYTVDAAVDYFLDRRRTEC